jgi:hypothetical protein
MGFWGFGVMTPPPKKGAFFTLKPKVGVHGFCKVGVHGFLKFSKKVISPKMKFDFIFLVSRSN